MQIYRGNENLRRSIDGSRHIVPWVDTLRLVVSLWMPREYDFLDSCR